MHRVLWVACALALVSLCLEYGFERPPLPLRLLIAVQLAAVGTFLGSIAVEIAAGRPRWTAVRRCGFDLLLILGCAAALVVEVELTAQPILKASTVYVTTLQAALLARIAIGLVRFNLALSDRRLHPARLMVSSFLVVIVLGAALLSLPKAMAPEWRHEQGDYLGKRLLNCLFTSVSATCVTGLVVYDTGRDFSRFGQIVILVLIQAGGLGIMIFAGLYGILLGRHLSLRQSLALQDAMSHRTLGKVRHMVRFVVVATFGCEAAGAVVLYGMWPAEMGSVPERLFYSVFHAVSAFCNAGFALQGDSLVSYRGAWQVYAGIMPLIVIGGLGFPVLSDLFALAHSRFRPNRAQPDDEAMVLPRTRPRGKLHPLSLHTKLVLSATAVLIVVPAIGFLIFESMPWRDRLPPSGHRVTVGSQAMADMGLGARAASALFQSVTARTAGFNTAAQDPESLSVASLFLTTLLMFVGGSPGSAAGGVKTVSVAVLALGVVSTLRGRAHVEGFRRTVPRTAVSRAAVVVILMFSLVSLVTVSLCVTERGESLAELLYESMSACGTVGLSTGLTPRLTVPGRIIIMVAMFAGRIGPLTLLVAMAQEARPVRYDYPEEEPVIG